MVSTLSKSTIAGARTLSANRSKLFLTPFVDVQLDQLYSDSRCMMQFDFSDHIVLFVAQYITPALLELDYLLVHRLSGTTGRNSSSANSVYLLPVVLCALSIFISLRAAFFTCLYFHTPAENLVGFAFAASCTLLPLCLHPGTVRWWLTQFNKE